MAVFGVAELIAPLEDCMGILESARFCFVVCILDAESEPICYHH
jgi:hypothetical protein